MRNRFDLGRGDDARLVLVANAPVLPLLRYREAIVRETGTMRTLWLGVVLAASGAGCAVAGCGGKVARSRPDGDAARPAAGFAADGGSGTGGVGLPSEGGDAGQRGSATGGGWVGGSTSGGSGVFLLCPDGRRVAVRGPACSDGVIDNGENCDDGNVLSGDGCSSQCRTEPGWTCLSAGSPCNRCGDGALDDDEECDDSNIMNGDGCSEHCEVEPGYGWLDSQQVCVWLGDCGDGRVNAFGEACDDGNAVGGDGCSADCRTIEPGYVCRAPGSPCDDLAVLRPRCGDAIVQQEDGEECEYGIASGPDGTCSKDCRIPYCGDGQLQRDHGEQCDDGLNIGEYLGCAQDCSRPPAPHNDVLGPYCGDGIVQPGHEQCDDGVENGHNGHCDFDCALARPGYCGDGVLDVDYEECDDGNWESCDGCSSLCQVEMAIP